MYISKKRFLALVAVMAAASQSQAEIYHYNNTLIGERANGMGGAYTAISDDPTGLFYNPAGAAYSGNRNLSISGNAYQLTTTTYESAIGTSDWTRTSSGLLPNFFGFTQPLGPGVVGFSYAVPESIQEDLDQSIAYPIAGVSNMTVNLNNTRNIYKFGPSYAQDFGWIALGVTLYGHMMNYEAIVNQVFTNTSGVVDEWHNTYYQTDEYGVEPIIGAMISPSDELAIGLSVRKTFVISSKTHYYATSLPYGGTTIADITHASSNKSVIRNTPMNIRGGAAWFASPSFILSGDISWYEGLYDDLEQRELQPVLNWAIGAEWYTSPTLALRAGLYSNNANTNPDVATYVDDHINYTGGSFSMTMFTRASSLTLGANYAIGNGKGNPTGIESVPAISDSLTLFLSSAFMY